MKDSYCSHCGSQHTALIYPKTCSKCQEVTYRNPLPVIVGVIPVLTNDNKIKILLGRRGISPGENLFALPGGYIDFTTHPETWEEALKREVFEETSLRVTPKELVGGYTSDTTGAIIIFATTQFIHENDVNFNFQNSETKELALQSDVIENGKEVLAFSSHTKMYLKYLEIFNSPNL